MNTYIVLASKVRVGSCLHHMKLQTPLEGNTNSDNFILGNSSFVRKSITQKTKNIDLHIDNVGVQ